VFTGVTGSSKKGAFNIACGGSINIHQLGTPINEITGKISEAQFALTRRTSQPVWQQNREAYVILRATKLQHRRVAKVKPLQ
jgi:hypothetical protein